MWGSRQKLRRCWHQAASQSHARAWTVLFPGVYRSANREAMRVKCMLVEITAVTEDVEGEG
jgi:hypothetical protein